jgi:hypothetical protein
MISIAEYKKSFFDRAAVQQSVDKAGRKVLSKFGAFVRTRAKTSIRKRKPSSAPGQPPSSHVGLLKNFILFGYDAEAKSVVIGPAKLNQKRGEAPMVLEHGGTAVIERWGRKRRVQIAARPYMAPALEQERPQLPKLWQDSVK